MEFLMTKTIVMEFFVLICPLCGQANERIVFVEGFSTLFCKRQRSTVLTLIYW